MQTTLAGGLHEAAPAPAVGLAPSRRAPWRWTRNRLRRNHSAMVGSTIILVPSPDARSSEWSRIMP